MCMHMRRCVCVCMCIRMCVFVREGLLTCSILRANAVGVDEGGVTRDLFTQMYERMGGRQCEGGLFRRLDGASDEQYALPYCAGVTAEAARPLYVQLGRLICKVCNRHEKQTTT